MRHRDAPLSHPPSASDVADHECGALDRPAEVDRADLVLDRTVVAEPLGLLVGVDVATDPRHHRREVDNLALPGIEPYLLSEAKSQVRLAEHVLHGMSHTKVCSEGERSKQLSHAHTTLNRRRLHDIDDRR